MPHDSPHVAILGAGFAALTAARELRRRAPELGITLVAPRPEFVYLPSLIWVPPGIREGSELIVPLAHFLRKQRVDHHAGTVTGLKDGGRIVLTDRGEIRNDALVIATGGRFLKGMPGIEHAMTLCEGVPAAQAIGRRLREMEGGAIAFGFGGNPKEPAAMRGGPMFELLFGVTPGCGSRENASAFSCPSSTPPRNPASGWGPRPSRRCSPKWTGAASPPTSVTRSRVFPPRP